MFSKAPRFAPKKIDDLPGPAAYDPKEPESRKKGAFLEKEERWREGKNDAPDTFGLYSQAEPQPQHGRVVSQSQSSSDIAKHRLEALRYQLEQQHAKEVKLLETQLARQSRKIEEHEDQGKELEKLKKEAKTCTAKEASLKTELNNAQHQLSFLPSLRDKFEALVNTHAESKTAHAASTAALQARLTASEDKLAKVQGEEAKLRYEGIAHAREVGRLGDELGKVRSEKGELEVRLRGKDAELQAATRRIGGLEQDISEARHRYSVLEQSSRMQSAVLCAQASAYIAQKDNIHATELHRLRIDYHTQQLQLRRMERKLQERQDQVNELVELVMAQEEEKSLLLAEQSDPSEEVDFLRHSQSELEDEHEDMLEESRIEQVELAASLEESRRIAKQALKESKLDLQYMAIFLEEQTGRVEELQQYEEKAEQLAGKVQELNVTLASAQAEQKRTSTLLATSEVELTRTSEAHQKAEKSLAEVQSEHAGLRTAHISLQSELAASHEARRTLSARLTQGNQLEASLRTEISDLNDALADYSSLQELHGELCLSLERMTRSSSIAAADLAELEKWNVALGGHDRPEQRIRHLQKVREEMAEVKKKLVSEEVAHKHARKRVEELETEIRAYKEVGVVNLKGAGLKSSVSAHQQLARSTLKQTKHTARDGNTQVLRARMSVSEFR